jgi:hypothetical protein
MHLQCRTMTVAYRTARLPQERTNDRNHAQEAVPARPHMRLMRNAIAPIRRRLMDGEFNMQASLTTTLRGAGRRALLPALTALALFAALPAAQAADQQETNAQIDSRLNWQAARGAGTSSDAYARASAGERAYYGGHHLRRYR